MKKNTPFKDHLISLIRFSLVISLLVGIGFLIYQEVYSNSIWTFSSNTDYKFIILIVWFSFGLVSPIAILLNSSRKYKYFFKKKGKIIQFTIIQLSIWNICNIFLFPQYAIVYFNLFLSLLIFISLHLLNSSGIIKSQGISGPDSHSSSQKMPKN